MLVAGISPRGLGWALAHQLVEPEDLVRPVHREDRKMGPEIAAGDIVAAQVRDHEDDRPARRAQLFDALPSDPVLHGGADLIDRAKERPGELGRALAGLR